MRSTNQCVAAAVVVLQLLFRYQFPSNHAKLLPRPIAFAKLSLILVAISSNAPTPKSFSVDNPCLLVPDNKIQENKMVCLNKLEEQIFGNTNLNSATFTEGREDHFVFVTSCCFISGFVQNRVTFLDVREYATLTEI